MRGNLSHTAYETILERIVCCQYAPGSMINEEQLVEELGCSRTPIRSALVRLQGEKLLKIVPKKGIVIREISLEDIGSLYSLRELMETYALENFGRSMDKSKLMEYARIFKDISLHDRQGFYSYDIQFHYDIVALTNNEFLCSYFQSLQNLMRRLAWLSGSDDSQRAHDADAEHLDIIYPWISDSYDEALRAMHVHIRNGREACYRVFIRRYGEKG